jgi:hypothetical protein
VRHSAIPEPTQLEISGELANYSVALGRVQGEDSTTFQLIGSGVCVIRNGIFGILTAHHCLHAAEPEVILGKLSTENLVFMVKRGRIIRERGAFLVEHELGSPPKKGRYTPSGPDLTFVEIPAGPTLASFRAMASFFNLDRNSVAVRRKHCVNHTFIAIVGFPQVGHDVRIANGNVHLDLEHIAMGASFNRQTVVRRRAGWDFVVFGAHYLHGISVPETLKGFSGGGIWTVLLRQMPDGKIQIEDFRLVGITYFQSGLRRKIRKIFGHFARSIYARGWANRGARFRPNQNRAP